MKVLLKSCLLTILVIVVAVIGFSQSTAYANYNEKTLPLEIQQAIQNYETTAEFQYVGNVNNLKTVIANAIEQLKQKDPYTHLNLHKWQASYKGTKDEVMVTFAFTYLTDAKKEAYVSEQVQKLAASIARLHKTDFDKVKAVHDYVVLNAQYAKNTRSSQHIAYTLLTEKKGVCQAYTALTYRLLDELGIESKIAIGQADGVAHSWNMVKLDGKWYHMDTTFDDPINNKSNLINFNYFLVTDKQIKQTHSWAAKTLPVANSVKYAAFNTVEQAVQIGNVIHFYDQALKKYRTLNVKTFKFATSSSSKYKSAVTKAK